MDTLIHLLIAHLVGDFVLQPNHWVAHKAQHLHRSIYLYYHLAVHACCTAIALQFQTDQLIPLLLVVGSHGLIDWLKLRLNGHVHDLSLFLSDQLAHLLILVGVAHWISPLVDLNSPPQLPENTMLMLLSFILLTFVSAVLIQKVMSLWLFADEQKNEALPGAGRYIGMLERLFVFGFVIMQQWQAVGWLIAAKSILRYSDLSRAKDRKLTEYVLLGTLMSIGAALLIALMYLLNSC